jgi:hypothetical protein
MGEDRLVTVAAVYSRSELYALLGLLRTNGIGASTVGEGHNRVDWPLAVALGGVRVMIPAADVDLARELLGGVDSTPYRGPVYSPVRVVDILMMVILTFLFSVPPPARIPAHIYLAARREPA